ncbi:MAG: GNAT family acetyltransferase [Acidimicrobiia bacterium]|nr:GNAT family acetyltransferase [Acidimicrobiia bacterium]
MVVIRGYRSEDRASVLEMWDQAWPEPAIHNVPAEDIDRKMADSPDLFIVAEIGGIIAGCVLAGFDGHRGWINRLVVKPEHRRYGVGQQLIREAEERLSKIGCHKVNLQIREGDESIVLFYESLGYRIEPRTMMGKLLSTTAEPPTG